MSLILTKEQLKFTREQLKKNEIERRAVEAAIWGMPLVNFDAMRQAYFNDANAQYNDIIYYPKFADWKYQATTPNNTTNYAMFFCNLKQGPIVVEVPPEEEAALWGSLIDSWHLPIIDIGVKGIDEGKGGKFLLLPPGYQENVPRGYIPVQFSTNNIYSLLRIVPKTKEVEETENVVKFIKKFKIYPLSSEPKSSNFIDMTNVLFNGLANFDERFYVSLARMISEEPIYERDLAIMGQLLSLGIGKDLTFNPDEAMTEILRKSIAEALVFMCEKFKNDGVKWWENLQWQSILKNTGKSFFSFLDPEKCLFIDERSGMFVAAFGPSKTPAPNLYIKSYRDSNGDDLDGTNTYCLRIPPHAKLPKNEFWSINVYDYYSSAFIREATVVGLDSYNQNLQENEDGSIDLFFSPEPPAGKESNWISTEKDKPFFLIFRLYFVDYSVKNKEFQWTFNDLEKVD
ncbi:DUF1254 domain-containing protein [Bacillus sp. JJ722]|uniref:DUF1254 domain-containing protein n=1 Tax=Bacillus sp. JJ722 TaxID=3122973 RepID=UPI002FFFFDC2